MYIESNPELEELNNKIAYVKNRNLAVEWIPSDPDCVYEYKTKDALNKHEAKNLYEKIIASDKTSNQPAYHLVESRLMPGLWRTVVVLERITHG